MPYSDDSNNLDIEKLLTDTRPTTVLDIGAGAGKYGRMVKRVLPETFVTAIEVWEPYFEEFSLTSVYDDYRMVDVREVSSDYYDQFDLVIFGDVLEHMTKEEAVGVFSKVKNSALISIPIVHYPQGHEHGNPYEEHIKDDWSIAEVLETFQVELVAQSDITAVFYKKADHDG